MLQEIIVYIILTITALHLIKEMLWFFKPVKKNGFVSSCSGGGCSKCSLKVDFSTVKPDLNQIFSAKDNLIQTL